MPFVTTRQMEF